MEKVYWALAGYMLFTAGTFFGWIAYSILTKAPWYEEMKWWSRN